MRRGPLVLFGMAALALCVICGRCGADTTDAGAPAPPSPAAPPPARSDPAGGPVAGTGPPGRPSPSGESHTEVHAPHPPAEVTGPETLDPDAVPEVLRAAEEFARAWSTPDPGRPDRIAELATPALAESLAEPGSPREPPAQEVAGPGFLLLDAPEWARTGVPTDRGTVVLDLVRRDDRWVVSAVDWRPGELP